MRITRQHPLGQSVHVFPVGCSVALDSVVTVDTDEGWVEVKPSVTRNGLPGDSLDVLVRVPMDFDVVWTDEERNGWKRGDVVAAVRHYGGVIEVKVFGE